MRIPFDIKFKPQIESGEYKVFLANGNPVRILAWDLPGEYPIAAADWPSDDETDTRVETYTEEGWDGIGEKTYDLFLVTTEQELSEFEDAVGCEIFDPPFNEEQIKVIKEESSKLLELARKELSRQGNIVLSIEEFERYLIEAQEKGRKEVEKDLPRWKTVEKVGNISIKEPYIITNMIGEKTLYIGLKGISIHSLEKLPGFKEGK